ncbi:MAG: Gfo/Idh/MocA family protein [Nitrospiraceae bacterium]
MIGIGVIGYGYWGPNLVRNFQDVEDCQVMAISDLRPDRLAVVAKRFPGIIVTRDATEVIDSPAVDAVIIATPVSSHFDLAMRAIRAGKHILVEKPLALTAEHALRLNDHAARRGCVLMVDHTFVYTGSVRKIRELIETQELGDLYYYDAVRVNLGLFQQDVNVLWDLAVHDLSIMDYVLPMKPRAVSATGMKHFQGEPDNIAYLTLFFDNRMIAHVHVNWLAPVKIRRTLLGGSQKMIIYDDVEPSEKVKVYDKGVTMPPMPALREHQPPLQLGYRMGNMLAPQLDTTEALKVEARHFIDCIVKQQRPVTDGEAGARLIQILEAASLSMANRGKLIDLEHLKAAA